jgi:hypothetical protein
MSECSATEAIFFAALAKGSLTERLAFLDQACAGDVALRRQVERLLACHPQVGRFLERPIVESAEIVAIAPLETLAADGRSAGGASKSERLDFLGPSQRPGALGRLGHYEILEVVGRGGMGIVLRAFDEKLHRVVAIKALIPALAASAPARERFVDEARATAAISHDNVIAIHAVEDDGPVPYLVMPFIDGPTLQEKVDRNGPLPLDEVLRIGSQIAAGLAAAHAQGLVHRDVKPANILLENGVERVKITDFGLAQAVDAAGPLGSGFIAGTPAYMSPEQARGEPVGHRSDLFSLGSVLYTICAGHAPFLAGTTRAMLEEIRSAAPRPLREVNPDIPEWLEVLTARLQAKDPADRFDSAAEVVDRLSPGGNAVRRDAPPTAAELEPRPAAGPPKGPPRGGWRWPTLAAGILVAGAGVGLSEASGTTDIRGAIIHLLSAEGTLVIEVDDPAVSVSIEDTELVITGAGAREIRLKPGAYRVRANKDGRVVRRELVSIARHGRRVVRISQESAPSAEAQAWERSVARMPAKEQVAEVARRLKELNPEFSGKVESEILDGLVTSLEFLSDRVADISPVRALKGLRSLDCSGTAPRHGRLSDLTPLRGMQLHHLKCFHSLVSDLEPLRGMPLETLHCRNTGVVSLSPVAGMELTSVTLQDTAVQDLRPLKGMPVKWLDLYGVRNVTDLQPLEGMPLEYLNVTGLPVNDLAVVDGMTSLQILILDDTRIRNISRLQGLRLDRISLLRTAVTDLTPIEGMPLTQIRLDYRPERAAFIRSFKQLQFINDKPVDQFWKAPAEPPREDPVVARPPDDRGR